MTHPPRTLLLLKPSSLGDIVHTLPVLAVLNRDWPETAIDWMVKQEWTALLENHPMLRDVLSLPRSFTRWHRTVRELRRRRYDMVIDLQGLLRSGLLSVLTRAPVRVGFANGREGSPWCFTHRITVPEGTTHAVERYLYLIQGVGLQTDGLRKFPLPHRQETEMWVDDLWRRYGVGSQEVVCMIHPAARWPTKRWPAERYAALADRMTQKGYRVVLIGGSAQIKQVYEVKRQMRHQPIDLAGQTDLQQLTALLRKSTVFVTNDSGPMHLAAAVGRPVVAIFGPTDPAEVGPYGPGHIVLQEGIDCSRCGRRFCRKGLACLKAIGIDEVCRAVETQVQRTMERRGP